MTFFRVTLWALAVILISAGCRAATSRYDVDRLNALEKRLEDLEINLAIQIAKQPVCSTEHAVEVLDAIKERCGGQGSKHLDH